MTVRYQIAPDGQLQASNQILLKQLQFSDRVEGSEAPNLPIRLAVALLADSKGVIDLNLPVSGSINDPQFRVGPIVWRMVLNLIGKAVTAPFALIAQALGGSAEDFSQIDFAAWLEENLSDIASVAGMPSGADILKMALGFEANSDKKLRSKVNLQDGGVQFEFVDDSTQETRTTMQAFERFTLGLPVFDGSTSAYPLEARLKYREKDGKLTFWYELIRPDRVFKTAVTDELGRIKEATGFPVVSGKP